MLKSLAICTFDSLTDNYPSSATLAWPEDFNDWLETPVKERAALWSPVTYKPGGLRVQGQTEANIATVHAVVLDYDGKPQSVSIEKATEVWGGFEHVVYTTFQHTPEKPRFRLVMPLSRPVTTSEFRRIWGWVQKHAAENGAGFDPLSDPGRIYFIPTHKPGADHVYRYNAEDVLDADIILTVAPPDTYRPTLAAGRAPVGSSATAPSLAGVVKPGGIFSGIETAHQVENLDRIEAQCAFMRHCREDAATLTEYEWYAWLTVLARCKGGERLAHEIGSVYPGYSPDDTADKFRRASTETGPRTCAHIATLGTACVGCPLGKQNGGEVTSPVQLGRPDPETATDEELREDAEARAASDLDRARAAAAQADVEVNRLIVEESVAKGNMATARRFGLEDNVRQTTEAYVAVRSQLQTAKATLKTAQAHLRATETQARRTANLVQADPRVVQTLLLDARTGAPKSSLVNVASILRGDAAYANKFFRYDEFAERVFYGDEIAADNLDTRINIDIQRRYNIDPKTSLVQEAIVFLAKENGFHPVRDYLSGLEWDGVARLHDLFKVGFGGTASADYLEDAGAKFCIGAVARIFDPGCKVDNMVVVTGKQGIGKSTAFSVLSSGWFSDSALVIGDKDAFMQMAGCWFYEVAELDSFKKAENTRIKQFLSSKKDKFRPPYGKHVVERPRQTILVGTTNEDQFLNDPTGSRRFVPIAATRIDIAWLVANRDQLWAEAVVRYKALEPWHYADESAERLAAESVPYQQDDVWEPSVYDFLVRTKKPLIYVLDVLTAGIGLEVARITRADKQRVMHILKNLGCTLSSDVGHKGAAFVVPEALYKVIPMPKPSSSSTQGWKSELPRANPSSGENA
jgi:putative DNA primase/helicase